MGAFIAIASVAQLAFLEGPYRPLNWAFQPQLYSMTCTLPPSQPSTTVTTSGSAGGAPIPPVSTTSGQTSSPTTYYFDAVLRADHTQELVATEHPVQVGPAVVDHAYLKPARVVLEVAMSDAMQAYQQGQYGSASGFSFFSGLLTNPPASKSVNAFQTFLAIQAARVPITLVTRYKTYQNMILELVRGNEDARTIGAFRGMLYFRQIISANVSQASTSARPNQTDSVNEGVKASQQLGLNGMTYSVPSVTP